MVFHLLSDWSNGTTPTFWLKQMVFPDSGSNQFSGSDRHVLRADQIATAPLAPVAKKRDQQEQTVQVWSHETVWYCIFHTEHFSQYFPHTFLTNVDCASMVAWAGSACLRDTGWSCISHNTLSHHTFLTNVFSTAHFSHEAVWLLIFVWFVMRFS